MLAACAGLLAAAEAPQQRPLDGGSIIEEVAKLKAGEYLWAPQIAPQGPMLLVVNLATQRLVVYRNGVPIGISTISTGRPGHKTPTGIFTILQKQVVHFSSIYDNAPMPYMQRLTWGGVALHGGHLPGYPASHGCIRLPQEFAKLLYSETSLGMTVVVLSKPQAPRIAPRSALLSNAPGTIETPDSSQMVWHPELSPTGPVTIVVSAADKRMIVLRNGTEIGSTPVKFQGVVDRVQAYVLKSVAGTAYQWDRVPLAPPDPSAPAATTPDTTTQSLDEGTDAFRQALATVVQPGTTMIVIPDSLGKASKASDETVPILENDDTPPKN